MFGSQTEKKSPQPPQPDKPPVQQATAPKSSPAKTVHQEVKPSVISVPKDEVKVESKEEEEFQGLPRPADYDDFWYEGEDGETSSSAHTLGQGCSSQRISGHPSYGHPH